MLTYQETGALLFGIVVGWVAYRTLRRSTGSGLADIATVIGAVGGASITGLFPAKTELFASYCFGLALGFFGYLLTAIVAAPKGNGVSEWLGESPGDVRSGGGAGAGARDAIPNYPPR